MTYTANTTTCLPPESTEGTTSRSEGIASLAGSSPVRYRRLHLYLIKPSKYDDEGFVIRYWRGVLPSNTLACLHGLSEDVRRRGALGRDLEWKVDLIDETVEKVQIRRIIRKSRRPGTKTVIGLVGVQSNQFPRASDLALEFRKAGIDVMIGGFHVSGILATFPELPAGLAALCRKGVTLVAGEVEGRWESILRDALNDKLQPVYNYLCAPPDLADAPMPLLDKRLIKRYAVRHFATLDCGRGCPFKCSFCTVINVQGRRMRFRSVESILDMIRYNYRQFGISFYFFTDDNFCRNKNWEKILDGLIRLRENEGIILEFMIQVDTESYRVPRFVEKAERAGCSQVFIGMESLNAANLQAAGKTQNRTQDFKALVSAYHEVGIAPHLAYIIGFPFDDSESVKKDIEKLRTELNAQQASFFMMTPLPGSMDYRQMSSQKTILDADLNNFDSFHETYRHSRMKPGEWTRAYDDAWKNFYSMENLKSILKKTSPEKYWDIFLNFIWYKNAIQVEGGHPMVHGFVRQKSLSERRPGWPAEGRITFFLRRVRELTKTLAGWVQLILEMEEVWLATRRRTPVEERVVSELARWHQKARGWRSLRLTELQNLYRKAALALEHASKGPGGRPVAVPSRFELWLSKWNVFSDSLTFSRRPFNRFWKNVAVRYRRGRVYQINFLRVVSVSLRESVLFSRFLLSILKRSVPTS